MGYALDFTFVCCFYVYHAATGSVCVLLERITSFRIVDQKRVNC